MNKTGLVLKVERNRATLLTNTGEFVKVAFSKNLPKIGETYSGDVKKEKNYLKYLTAAVALFIVFLSGGGAAYAYYTPVATIQVSINPSIELKINRFDKIIKYTPINADGVTLLQNLKLKNKNIDDALTLVVDEAKKDNFIKDNYNELGKTISVTISAKGSDKIIKLDKFQEYIAQNKINTKIDDNGKKTNQEFTDIDKSINKEVPADTTKKDNKNPLNKNDNNTEKNKNNDKAKDTEGQDKKGDKKSNSSNKNNITDKTEPKSKGIDIPKNLPSIINKDKLFDKSGGVKEESSKSKKTFDKKN